MRRALFTATLAIALFGCAREAEAAPKKKTTYLVSGALVFGLPYIGSDVVGIGYSLGRNVWCTAENRRFDVKAAAGASTEQCPNQGFGWLTIPIAGPFLSAFGYRHDPGTTTLLLADGALQIAGASLFVAGLTIHEGRRETGRLYVGPGTVAGTF